ncbi:diguanylate cyclase [Paucibacter sp. APW11]|uniref:diguanylate cyclase n=1 Tax=Roseateles aquae TaxID=3077235 RepID=A0ABU3PAH1_9BURK|nr:two-component regulator propeller domain-containing protein [Paucibacter sp. APW11]MDT8999530.1 diguanylate cyclase [Paucibacter sp. APW11]
MLARLLFALLLVLSWLGPLARAQAQAQVASLQEPRFESVGDASSITDGVVSALAQDRRGFIWIGTSVGLVRYDGYQLRPFTMERQSKSVVGTSFIRALLAGRDGSLWIGTESDGLARYEPDSGRWSYFNSNAGDPHALAPGTIRALAQDGEGRLWVGTIGGGLDRFDPASGHFQHLRKGSDGVPDDRIQTLFFDSRGDLWLGSWNGLARLRRGERQFESVFSNSDQELAGRIVSMLAEAPDGRIWAGTQSGELALIDPARGSGRWIAQDAAGLKRGTAYALVAINAQELWLGRAGGIERRSVVDGELLGLLRHDVRKPWGLSANDVRVLMRDRSGWIWLGSYGGGVQRYQANSGALWVRRPDLAEDSPLAEADVRSLLQLRSGEIWAGTNERGIAVLDRELRLIGAIRPEPERAEGFRGGRVGGLAQDAAGDVWVGTDTAVYRFSAGRELLARYQAGKGRVRRLLGAADGSVWIGTQDGLYRYRPGETGLSRMLLQDGRALTGDVNALAATVDGGLWIGAESGIYRIAPGSTAVNPVPSPPGEGLSNLSVLGLLVARNGVLWVDTAAGLHRMNAWDGYRARFERIGEKLGAPGRGFGANLLDDSRGRIWTHRAVLDPISGSVDELGQADGVDFGTGWFRAYTRLDDGRMLFGGSRGILALSPDRFERWSFLPPVVLTDLRIDGRQVPPAAAMNGLRLDQGTRSFSLEFAALDYSSPAQLRYRYRLEGYDHDWINAGSELRLASYGNLPPGDYRLHVQGSNRIGIWSPQQLEVAVHVEPAWWQTWWARLLAVASVLGGLYAIVQGRTRYLRRAQMVLERRVRERTTELEALSQALEQKSAALEESSLSDPLTGLRNRRFLSQHVEADVALAVRRYEGEHQHGETASEGRDLIFFLVDIDHFKQVNDVYGHSAGDAVLVQMTTRLKQVFRDADYLVRWGGEEFLIVARAASRGHAAELAERARAMVADQDFVLDDGTALRKTCSVGFACFPLSPRQPRALDWSAVVDLADAALYAVKRGGRNGWLGLVSADAESDEGLREWSRRPLAEWVATGRLQMAGSGAWAREQP